MDNNDSNNLPPSNNNEQNNITPGEDKKDFADKTIAKVEGFMDTKNHSDEFTNDDVNSNKNSALLCYIPFVSLYFILNGSVKKSDYLKCHANQGLDVTILSVLVYFLAKVLSSIFRETSFIINDIPGWLEVLIAIMYFICFLYMLFGIINTVNGSSKELPIIGKIKLIK